MSDSLRELYQEVILDHNKNPKNFVVLPGATHSADGNNPLCGDRISVYLELEKNRIKDISFQGNGCAISVASASVMTTELKGKTKKEVEDLFEQFQMLVTGKAQSEAALAELGKLAVFAGVSEYPVRVKCATLAWHTMFAAINKKEKTVSTE